MGVMFGPQTPRTGHRSPMKLLEQKAFCLVNQEVQWQVRFACLNQGSLQPGGSNGTPDDYLLTQNKSIKHVL